jgi:hypothetical protein
VDASQAALVESCAITAEHRREQRFFASSRRGSIGSIIHSLLRAGGDGAAVSEKKVSHDMGSRFSVAAPR